MTSVFSTIQLRRNTPEWWTANNIRLANGEPGYESGPNGGKFKIGDGSTLWNQLPYFQSSPITIGAQTFIADSDIVPLTIKGYATQTVSLTEWKNSANSLLASISSTGDFYNTGIFKTSGSSFVLNLSNGNHLMRLVNSTSFTDAVATSFLQLGNAADANVAITGYAGAVLGRVLITSPNVVIDSSGYGSAAVPGATLDVRNNTTTKIGAIISGPVGQSVDLLQLKTGTSSVFTVSQTGATEIGGSTTINGALNILNDSGTNYIYGSSIFKSSSLSTNGLAIYTENDTAQIGDTFSGVTHKTYLSFAAGTTSNDPGFIMHETSTTEINEGVIHISPSDDNAYGDYVSIHGTNDPDAIKLHTDGTVDTKTTYIGGTPAVQNTFSAFVPTGSLTMFAGAVTQTVAAGIATATSAPQGWLLCDGSAISRTTYASLYNVIGTTYGAGDGSTTFDLPDLRGRIPIGSGTGAGDGASGSGAPTGGTALTARTLGEWGGAQGTSLTVSHIPQHAHAIDHNHASFTTASGGTHSHTFGADDQVETQGGYTYAGAFAYDATSTLSGNGRHLYVNGDGAHTHSIDVPAFTGTSGNYGTVTVTPVPAVQPFIVVNYIIKL